MSNLNQTFSNVPVSQPISHPDIQLYPMNGFAWSNQGIVHQTNTDYTGTPDSWFGSN